MEAKVGNILHNVQMGSVNHQKNIKLLENIYNSVKFEEFLGCFIRYLQGLLQENFRNPCFKFLLEFLAKFVGHIARVQNTEPVEFEDDPPTHPFLTAVIKEVVKHHDLPINECRYNACNFLSLTLQNIGEKTQMDGQICDMIQNAMIENIQDHQPLIRLQAVLALVRLQDPLNPECPVIRAYITCLNDCNYLVRREAVKRIAPNALTIPKLKEKTRDRDANVRSAAFGHIAEIGIKHFKIIHRQFILKSGFCETSRYVKKIFLEYLLPKWLTSLNGEYIAFLNAIKLDAEESDILNTEELSRKIMEVFFQTEPIDNLIKALPLDENKVIPLNTLRNELAHYWNILTTYLRKSDEMDEYLNTIIPELTPFCNYLEKLINTKFAKPMEDWEYLDFQYMLYHLFDITEHYDLSEEVGRRTLDNLLKKVLGKHRLQPRLLNKIVQIARKLTSNVDLFTNEMCLIISDIREPLIEQEPSTHDKREKEFKMAELTVKLNILEGDLEDAIDAKDFQKAQVLKNEIEEYRRKMEGLNSQSSQVEKVRVSKDDPETVSWCLDLLAAILIHSDIKILSPSLVTCRQEFLKPLIQSNNAEIGWRVFKCIAAYCVFDKKMAEEHFSQLLMPRRIFSNNEDPSTTSTNQTSTRRRLYTEEVDELNVHNNQMTATVVVNVVLDMLDDESDEIRDTAITAIAKLMISGFPINPMVITRLILKWYNPLTQKTLQQKLGMIIKEYTEKIRDAREIIAKAVISILTKIADAPKTSPLAEVDIENVLRFLAAITDSGNTNGLSHVHLDLARTLIREIASNPANLVTPYSAKMLNYMSIDTDNSPPIKELMAQAEVVLEKEALDKGPKHHLVKFIAKLNGSLTVIDSTVDTNSINNESAGQTTTNTSRNTTVPRRLSSVVEEDNEQVIITTNKENGTEQTKESLPSKRRRIVAENPNDKASGEIDSVNNEKQVDSLESEEVARNNGEPQEKRSDNVQTDPEIQKETEPSKIQSKSTDTDPDIISPSISPDSQEQIIHSLRKRTRSNNIMQEEQPKKGKAVGSNIAKKARKDRKEDNSQDNRNNNGKGIELDSLNKSSTNAKSNDEKGGDDEENNTKKSKRKEKEISDTNETVGAKQAVSKSGTKVSKKGKDSKSKINENNDVARAVLQPSSSSDSNEINNPRRSLRVNHTIEQNIVVDSSDKASLNTRRNNKIQKDKELVNNDKENSSKSQKSDVTSSSSGSNSKKLVSDSEKSANKKTGARLRKQAESVVVSSSSESLNLDNQKKFRNANKKKALGEEKSRTNKTTSVESQALKRLRGRLNSLGANTEQKGSSSESSTRSTRSLSRSLTSLDLITEKRTRLAQRENANKRKKKTETKSNRSASVSSQNTSSRSRSLSSQSSSSAEKIAETTLEQRENGRVLSTTTKKISATRQAMEKSKPNQPKHNKAEKIRTSRRNLFRKNSRSESQSSASEANGINKGRINNNNKKCDKEMENNRVNGKKLEIRVNRVQVQKPESVLQVKRKKIRGRAARNVTEESIKDTDQGLSDSSEQSLHTIIEPSQFHMSLLPDGSSPENSPQRSLRNSRRLQVVVSATSSDSESTNSSIRKSARKIKKKV